MKKKETDENKEVLKNRKAPEMDSKSLEKAQKTIGNKAKTKKTILKAEEKAERHRSVLHYVWDDLSAMFRMAGAWSTGRYTRIPMKTLLFSVGTILYFINPFDVLPDIIPSLGYVDDVAFIGYTAISFRSDIKRFLLWEKKQKQKKEQQKKEYDKNKTKLMNNA